MYYLSLIIAGLWGLIECLLLGIAALVLIYVAACCLIIGAKKIKEELRGGSNHDKD